MLNYVPDDGYNEPGYIKAVSGIHGPLRFKFRPMLPTDRATILISGSKLAPDLQQRSYAQAMRSRMVSWDLKDAHGNPAPITDEVMCRLKPKLFGRLFDVIAGLDAPDDDPDAVPGQPTVDDSARLQAAIAGVPYGNVKAEADLKN
jgi:hypothetical protein